MRRIAFVAALSLLALSSAASEASAKYFANLPLVDQNGKQTDLYSVMKDRTIIINTFFATCTASCPVLAKALVAIQNHYPDRLGKDLVLVSITVDPANDSPEKLKAYAQTLRAKSGWYFLTGSKEQVEAALRKIGQYAASRDEHQNIFIVGNDRTGLWKKVFGLASADEIVKVVDSVVNDPQ